MLRTLRRAFRRVFPRRLDPWLDAPSRHESLDDAYRTAYAAALHDVERESEFAVARFDEAIRWRNVLDGAGVGNGLVLDLGSGSGGAALALSASGRRVVTVDCMWNETARIAHRSANATYRHAIADSSALPFRACVFAAAVSLDSFEHFAEPSLTASEVSRVVEPAGAIVVETPARLAWLFRPDPHFGIRFLLLLSPALQRRVAARRGFDQPHHYVHRIYASASGIARLFPGCRLERILRRSRFPAEWFYEALVLRKNCEPKR